MNILKKVKFLLAKKKDTDKEVKEKEEGIKLEKIKGSVDLRKGEPIPVPKDPTLQNK